MLEKLADEDGIRKQLRGRRSTYLFETIRKSALEEYEADGWELHKENKNTDRVRKLKTHDVMFENRVWQLFAKLGFTRVPMSDLPEKVFKDCAKCPRRDACDEIPMIKEFKELTA